MRGAAGLPADSADDSSLSPDDQKTAKAVGQIIDAIEARHAGRLAQIDEDIHSGVADRVIGAKKLLDETLDEATQSASLASLKTTSLRPLGGEVVNGSSQLINGQSRLLCEIPKDGSGQPLHLGRGGDGRYGDDRTGALGAAADSVDLVDTHHINVFTTLDEVDRGVIVPDPESRLGAYAATRGYPAGTVGHSVHNAIGTIFASLANYGQEKIGRVFNSPQARALYNQPVSSCAGYQMAMLEHQYWADVANEDGYSPGGNLGAAFSPTVRNFLQNHVF